MAKFLRKVALVLSICLSSLLTPTLWTGYSAPSRPNQHTHISYTASQLASTNIFSSQTVTCPPPPRGCW